MPSLLHVPHAARAHAEAHDVLSFCIDGDTAAVYGAQPKGLENGVLLRRVLEVDGAQDVGIRHLIVAAAVAAEVAGHLRLSVNDSELRQCMHVVRVFDLQVRCSGEAVGQFPGQRGGADGGSTLLGIQSEALRHVAAR